MEPGLSTLTEAAKMVSVPDSPQLGYDQVYARPGRFSSLSAGWVGVPRHIVTPCLGFAREICYPRGQ